MANASVKRLGDGLSGTSRFVYNNSYWLVVISLAWTVSCLPVITIGPATLGAYTAIRELNSDRNRVNPTQVFRVVRRRAIPATVFGLLPPLFFGLSASYLYVLTLEFTILRLAIMVLTFYVGVYLSLVLVPTFVGLSQGQSGKDALRFGVQWVASNPTSSMTMGVLTLALLLTTTVFTVAFVLVYAGFAFSMQVRLVENTLS
ncbi:Protein of unknown function, DUF624 [Halogranum gelatinilyticum]|uniref:DUF4013 domain-containing protein n=1 Tax=Halogranum gelatinilyticum TaxID=660521 RepID=A0A1G9ZM10_9EURY|nr:YesL family protein [Halogranum gelatinilyticum]SDN22522.1 Protein of unknown function, DUF624 [Halogranum gelatinilyticum]